MTIVKRRGLKRTRSSASTTSSSDSPLLARKKKRVSFAHSLEETRIINEENKIGEKAIKENIQRHRMMTDVKPQKGILKQSPILTTKTVKSTKTKNEESELPEKKPKTPKSIETEPENEESNAKEEPKKARQQKQQNKGTSRSSGLSDIKKSFGKKLNKRTIKVRRSTKEILMGLGKKERREFIRQLEAKNKPNYELTRKALLLWEVIRSSKTNKDEKEKCIQELLNLCRGKLAKLIYSHATCRVVQCLIMLKRDEIREVIFDELKPEIVRMAKSNYAKNFVAKMLKYGSKEQRDIVINAFQGHYMDLYKIIYAAQLIEQVYNEWATADQRHSMVAEFYGSEFTLFKNEQNLAVSQLNINVIAEKYPERMSSLVQSLEKLLEETVLKIPMLKLTLTHKLLLDYLTHCSPDQRKSMIDSLKDQLPEICHTQEGSRAALLCIWNADVKERKAIVKSFKGLALRTCQDHCARRAMFGIFDCVDDTTLVNEIFTKEIADNLADLIYHKNGIWTLHYLVHPRDYRVIGKGLYDLLKQGDSNPHSKKPSDRRYAELFEHVRDPLLTFMIANMREIITNKTSAVLVLDTLEVASPSDPFIREIADEHIDSCFRAIAEVAADEFIPHSPDGPSHIVQGGCARFVFRKLLQTDPKRKDGHKLSDFLADLPPESLASWIGMNCGLYALVEMYKSGSTKARKVLKEAISLKSLKSSQLAGANALLDQFMEVNIMKTEAPKTAENGHGRMKRMVKRKRNQKNQG